MDREIAEDIVEALFDDLTDRAEIGDVFEALQERVRMRIAMEWTHIILELAHE